MYQKTTLNKVNKRTLYLKKVREEIGNINSKPGVIKIIYVYRYISWLLTSLFYLIGEPRSPLVFKLGVILSLLIAAKIVTDICIKSSNSPNVLKTVIITEIVGITLLLLPTGGIKSPFVWYALNPVLFAAIFLSPIFCWINLFFYILCSGAMSFAFFNYDNHSIRQLIVENSNVILILVLITVAVELMGNLTRQLNKQATDLETQKSELSKMNLLLEAAKSRADESLENIMSLYQVVEAFSNQNNLREFMQVFTEYTTRLTKSEMSFFWISQYKNDESIIVINGDETYEKDIISEIETLWKDFRNIDKSILVKIKNRDFVIISVKSVSRIYGFMGILIDDVNYHDLKLEYFQKLSFLSELSAVILERFLLEEITDNFMLVEEQNRIANEMHDNVSQRMFGISCAIHSIKARWKEMTNEQINEQLDLINEASNEAMKELRTTIYRLSSKKRGEKFFILNLQKYFDEFSKLNNINIDFKISGNPEELSGSIKKSLYRIIHEATGNAVRHGRCSNLHVSLQESPGGVKLSIADDGVGFELDKVNSRGLGLSNMEGLVKSLNGRFNISSNPGNGTGIYIVIPRNRNNENMKEGAVL